MSRATIHAASASLVLVLSLTASMTVSAGALRVVRDPVTGEMRGPTAAEARAFEKAEAQIRAGNRRTAQQLQTQQPAEIQHPDGSVELKLGEDTMMYSVVATGRDGTLNFDCLPAKQAQKFIKAKQASSSKASTEVGHAHK